MTETNTKVAKLLVLDTIEENKVREHANYVAERGYTTEPLNVVFKKLYDVRLQQLNQALHPQ